MLNLLLGTNSGQPSSLSTHEGFPRWSFPIHLETSESTGAQVSGYGVQARDMGTQELGGEGRSGDEFYVQEGRNNYWDNWYNLDQHKYGEIEVGDG